LAREAVQNVKARAHNHVKEDLEGVYKWKNIALNRSRKSHVQVLGLVT
jgi:hypothetical protein